MKPIGKGVYRYVLEQDFTYKSKHLEGVSFYNKWVKIENGQITVSKGYAWDGCSPSFYVPIFGWIGTPDGKRDSEGYPQAYHASLVHDALCQFHRYIEITKQDSIDIFRDLLLQAGFSLFVANVYARVVYRFGPQDWLGDRFPVKS